MRSELSNPLLGNIDLHVHTTASDGSFSPSEVVKLASEANLSAIAITDHDSTLGYHEAAIAGKALGVEVVSGIEISSQWRGAVHILGYFVDSQSQSLQNLSLEIVSERDRRNLEICSLMQKDGLRVNYDKMKERFGPIIGRPHFAQLLAECGMAPDTQSAFSQYMESGKRYYRPRSFIPAEDAISVIRKAGGLPVLAHPFQYRLDDTALRELISFAVSAGLLGIECFYSGYSARESQYLTELAKDYHLLVTGGSDFHGIPKPQINLGTGTGDLAVSYSFLAKMKAFHSTISNTP